MRLRAIAGPGMRVAGHPQGTVPDARFDARAWFGDGDERTTWSAHLAYR